MRTNVVDLHRKAPDGRPLEAVTLGLTIKSLTDDGKGTGYLSVFGNEDSYGDVVDPGAYAKTIAERNTDNPLPFLWQHDSTDPIGIYTRLEEDDHGLYTEFAYALKVQRAREAFELAQMKAVKGMSIGFTTIKDVIDAGVRRLKEVRLWEGSQVTFPANDLATITGVKDSAATQALIKKLAADVAALKEAVGQGKTPGASDPSADAAAIQALLADIRGALPMEPRKQGEPDMSTRADRQAVADLRREMQEFLAA